MMTITLFGSSKPPAGSQEYVLAYEVGRALAHAGFIVCNGGYGGTMEAAARGAKEFGGSTVGVTADVFDRDPNQWIDKEIREKTLVDRLSRLIEIGDAYVVFKGGTGTLLELAAVWEFVNKGLIREKPIVIVGAFWKPLVGMMREELLWEGLGDCTRLISQVGTAHECAEVLRIRLSTPSRK